MVFLVRPRMSTAGVVVAEHREQGIRNGASGERGQDKQDGEKGDWFHTITVLRKVVRQNQGRMLVQGVGRGKGCPLQESS